MEPPPTSFLYLIRARSGSIPVVSQSMRKLIVPVGALAECHQQGAEVGVAEPELAERLGVGSDRLGRVRRVADDDLLGEEDDLDRVLVRLDVESAVLAQEFQQIKTGQIAS